jgi:hypothetical protein
MSVPVYSWALKKWHNTWTSIKFSICIRSYDIPTLRGVCLHSVLGLHTESPYRFPQSICIRAWCTGRWVGLEFHFKRPPPRFFFMFYLKITIKFYDLKKKLNALRSKQLYMLCACGFTIVICFWAGKWRSRRT